MSQKLPDSLSARVQLLREKLNLTTEELSTKSYLDLSTIQDIEEGRETFLSTTTRQKLSKALRISAKTLKDVEKTPKQPAVSKECLDYIKNNILEGNFDNNTCPKCNSKLICKIVTLKDLYDNEVDHPKARCIKCPFQIK